MSKVALDGSTGCNPCHSLVDFTAGWLGTQKVGSIVGDALFGAMTECSVDYRIPSGATTGLGGALPKGVYNPSGWLVGECGKPVPMSSLGFAVHVHVVNEEFTFLAAATSRHSRCFWCPERCLQIYHPLFQLCVCDSPRPTSGVESCRLCSSAAEGGDEDRDPLRMLVGQMGAFVMVKFGVGEVDGVGFLASAHGDVDPFAVDAVTGDSVSPTDSGTLGLVSGEGVSPVEVAVVEVPVGHGYRVIVAVEVEGDGSTFDVDSGHGGEVAVENSEPRSVLETYDAFPSLEHSVVDVQRGSLEESCLGDERAGPLVELADGGVAVADEEHLGRVAGGFDVAVPVLDGLVDGVVDIGSYVDLPTSVVHCNGTVDRPVTEFGKCGSFPLLILSDVLNQLDGRDTDGQGSEQAASVDLGELVMVADHYELPCDCLGQVGHFSDMAAADHASLVDNHDGTRR